MLSNKKQETHHGDEIANVNFFTMMPYTYYEIQKREEKKQ